MDLSETLNADFIDAQYKRWKADPDSVSSDWRFFFEGFELAGGPYQDAEPIGDEAQAFRQCGVQELIFSYRNIGHLLACLDPLTSCPTDHPLLNPKAFNLDAKDLDILFYAQNLFESPMASLKHIIKALKETYCRSIGVEFMHLQDPDERRWLQDRMEPVRNRPDLSTEDKLGILEKL
jgi:2-oxoglutarate dehydrogenase E1 component